MDQLAKFNGRLADLARRPDPHTIDGIVLTKMDTIDDKARPPNPDTNPNFGPNPDSNLRANPNPHPTLTIDGIVLTKMDTIDDKARPPAKRLCCSCVDAVVFCRLELRGLPTCAGSQAITGNPQGIIFT